VQQGGDLVNLASHDRGDVRKGRTASMTLTRFNSQLEKLYKNARADRRQASAEAKTSLDIERWALESQASVRIDAMMADETGAPAINPRTASQEELLRFVGYSPDKFDEWKIERQHFLALGYHNAGLPHNCGEYCPGKINRPHVAGAPVYESD
jgi:hypothetical protein